MTENELLDALRDAMASTTEPEGALTTKELSRAMGRGERVVRDLLADLIAAGRVECVRVDRPGIDRVMRHRPAFRLL